MTNSFETISEPVRRRNRKLGLLLTALALSLAIGCYLYLDVTQYNPFTKPSMMDRGGKGH